MEIIRHLEPHEWPLLKELRLKALLSDPQEFSESFDEAKSFSDGYWKDLTKDANDPNSSKTFILENDKEIIGFVFAIRSENECRLGGLWIEPVYRKQDLGDLLIDHVKDWSLNFKNNDCLKLWSSIGNLSDFYIRCGFEETDNIKPHPIKNSDIIEMIWQKNKNAYDLRNSLETDNVWLDSLRREAYKNLFFETWGDWDEDRHTRHFTSCLSEGHIQIIEINQLHVGMIQLFDLDDAIEISEIQISASYQGKGLASQIIRDILRKAKNLNKKVTLSAGLKNIGAIKLYKKLGFKEVNRTETKIYMECIQ